MARQKKTKKKKSFLGRVFRSFLLLALLGAGASAWLWFQPFKTPAEALAEVGAAHTPEGWLPVISQGFQYEPGTIAFLDGQGLLAPACLAPPSSAGQPSRQDERIDLEYSVESNSALAVAALLDSAAGAALGSRPLEQAFKSSAKIRVRVERVVTETYAVEQLGTIQGMLSPGCLQAVDANADNQPIWIMGARWFQGVEISLLDERGDVVSLDGGLAGSGNGSFEVGSSGEYSLRSTEPIPVCVRPWRFARATGPGGRPLRVAGGGAPIQALNDGAFSAKELKALEAKMRSR